MSSADQRPGWRLLGLLRIRYSSKVTYLLRYRVFTLPSVMIERERLLEEQRTHVPVTRHRRRSAMRYAGYEVNVLVGTGQLGDFLGSLRTVFAPDSARNDRQCATVAVRMLPKVLQCAALFRRNVILSIALIFNA